MATEPWWIELRRLRKVESALQDIVNAYEDRFITDAKRGRLLGPIDPEIIAARKLLRPPQSAGSSAQEP